MLVDLYYLNKGGGSTHIIEITKAQEAALEGKLDVLERVEREQLEDEAGWHHPLYLAIVTANIEAVRTIARRLKGSTIKDTLLWELEPIIVGLNCFQSPFDPIGLIEGKELEEIREILFRFFPQNILTYILNNYRNTEINTEIILDAIKKATENGAKVPPDPDCLQLVTALLLVSDCVTLSEAEQLILSHVSFEAWESIEKDLTDVSPEISAEIKRWRGRGNLSSDQ